MMSYLGTIIAVIIAVAILILGDFGQETRIYDCGMAEWHPDIPAEVREECRKRHYENWKQHQETEKRLITI